MTNFIMEFKQALSPEQCQAMIAKFQASTAKKPGATGAGIDKRKKDSTDLYLTQLSDWQNECQQINQVLLQALMHYARNHPFFVIGAIAASKKDINSGNLVDITAQDITQMPDQQLAQLVQRLYMLDDINLQHYNKGSGGYHHWHSEHYPHPTDPEQRSLRRVLLWLLYLNDVEQGGTTDFYFQQTAVKPTEGSLILAPCGFTHTHRGAVPESNDKYVLASWVLYRTPEQLYSHQ
jgi:hypothetical protein